MAYSLLLSPSHTHTHTHKSTHTYSHMHTYDTRGVARVQMLLKAGGAALLMLVRNGGTSCLYTAFEKGHTAVVEVCADETGRGSRACARSDGT